MSLSQDGLQAALAQWTDQVFLECLTFEHPTLPAPLRLVNDRQDLTRTAGTFTAFPFEVTLHPRTDESVAQASITADNVDRRITEILRSVQDPLPTVTYELVLADSPNTVEAGPMEFEVKGFSLPDLATITIRIAFALDFLNNAFPKDYFAPWNSAN